MNQKKAFLKPIYLVLILIVLVGALSYLYVQFKPKADKGDKEITVEVVISNEETKDFVIDTNAGFLRQALDEKSLIKGTKSSYGFYITEVNGRIADESKQEWWCITQDGGQINYGVDDIAIKDGDHYEITLKQGY